MTIIFVFGVSCMVLGITLYFFSNGVKKERKERRERLNDLALHLTVAEFQKTLDFMLMFGVIDFKQYNELNIKSLPYLKG